MVCHRIHFIIVMIRWTGLAPLRCQSLPWRGRGLGGGLVSSRGGDTRPLLCNGIEPLVALYRRSIYALAVGQPPL